MINEEKLLNVTNVSELGYLPEETFEAYIKANSDKLAMLDLEESVAELKELLKFIEPDV